MHLGGGLLHPGNPEYTHLPKGRGATGCPFSGRPQLVQRLTQVGALNEPSRGPTTERAATASSPRAAASTTAANAVRMYSDPPRTCTGAQGPGGGPPPLRGSAPHSDPPPSSLPTTRTPAAGLT